MSSDLHIMGYLPPNILYRINNKHKLLSYQRPQYPPYYAQTIPRHYSNFYDMFNYRWRHHCAKLPKINKGPQFPVQNLNIETTLVEPVYKDKSIYICIFLAAIFILLLKSPSM
jgi:hypothetical protein